MTVVTSVAPSHPATLTDTTFASGAAPSWTPPDVVPSPAIRPAMWVPWPKRSRPSWSPVRSTRASSRSPRFADGATPVSMEATVTSSPRHLPETSGRLSASCQVVSADSRS